MLCFSIWNYPNNKCNITIQSESEQDDSRLKSERRQFQSCPGTVEWVENQVNTDTIYIKVHRQNDYTGHREMHAISFFCLSTKAKEDIARRFHLNL